MNVFFGVFRSLLAVFLLAFVERMQDAAESSRGNATQISAVGLPNLVPVNVVLSSYAALPGDALSLGWTMTNSGNAFCYATFTAVRLGASPTVPPASSPLDLTFTTREIAAKSAVQQTVTITVPSNIPLGTYYIWVFADAFGSAGQSTTADDIARSAALTVQAVRGQPNLRPLNIALNSATVRPGDPITVMWSLTNSGTVPCPASYTGLHLGTSPSSPPTDAGVLLATPSIAAGSALRFTNSIAVPAGAALGTYYAWVIADDVADSTLNQSSRADDAAPSPAFSVSATLPQPNLAPQNITLSRYSARPGDTIAVMWTLTNSGTATCPASFTGLHLGDSATAAPLSDSLNLQVPTPSIVAGGSLRMTNVVTLPAETAFGNYFVWVVADDVDNSSLNQTTRADDAARSAVLTIAPVVTRPNLVPQNIRLGSYSVAPGDLLTVMWTVANTGDGDCPPSYTGLHLGTSATEPPPNQGLLLPTPEIAAHSFIRQTNTVTISADLIPGNYYLWVIVDNVAFSTVDQTTREDDASHSGLLAIATVPAQPNLVPQDVTLSSDFARVGDPVTVRWTLKNVGSVTCPASLTGLVLGQAAGDVTNATLHITLETPEIPAGGSLQQTNSFVVPVSAAPGTNYAWVIADDLTQSTLNQSSRADDIARSGALGIVTELPQPNLVPLSVTLSTNSVRPGNPLILSWVMTNSGNANCPASTTGVHLGTSPDAAPSSDSLNLKFSTPAIATQSSVGQTNFVIIPANVPAGTYYLWVVADDVASSPLNQSSRADDASRSEALAIVTEIARPNLVPSAISLSTVIVAPGGEITVTWTLSNTGTANCPASTTGLHLGPSPITPPIGDSLNVKVTTPAIDAQSNLRQTNKMTIPTTVAPGTYYVWVVADDVANSSLNQTSKADDAVASSALVVSAVSLQVPASGAKVSAPPSFSWLAPGLPNASLYLANKSAPVLGTDAIVFVDNLATNALTLSLANWQAAVNALGYAANYYWTIGSVDPAHRQTFALWRPFQAQPLLLSPVGLPDGGGFRFDVLAPHQAQVPIQSSDNLTSWTNRISLRNQTGSVIFSEGTVAKRYYRVH